jgi:PDZ domain-containing protein
MSYYESPVRRKRRGIIPAAVFILALLVVAMVPSPYVIERPGQSFNVMSDVSGSPVISSTDLEIYPSDSRLDILTVSLVGNRDVGPTWLQVLTAWLDPAQSVVPMDEIFPPNLSAEEISAESVAMMETSQQEAVAAALIELGYEIPRVVYVSTVYEDAPSSGKLIAGDFIRSVGGVEVVDLDQLKDEIQKTSGSPIEVEVSRGGNPVTLSITPELRDDSWIFGILVGYSYDFPVDLELQLGQVGGPSGGMMFALGIIDALTSGSLAGANHVAGTGTIAASGEVGPIGGIRLKMIAAERSGATLFIGPRDNCSEIVGNIPNDLDVVVVDNLDQALAVVDLLRNQLPFGQEYRCSTN